MIRIFLTGDNHIGLKYASHEKAAVLASKRLEAFEGMVRAANKEECDLFVIAGDLFENTYSIAKKEIRILLGFLKEFKGTVVILPGNHDYYDQDVKVWTYFKAEMEAYDNILLLTEEHPYEKIINGKRVWLYPALCTALHSAPGQNHLGWIKNETILQNADHRIGIAHGAVEGESLDREGQYFLMKREELEKIPMDVWLIGHTHVPFPRSLTEEYTSGERIFNAGTHVQTDVSCNTQGQCMIIEINDAKEIRAKKILSGNLRFYRKTIKASAGRMKEAIEEGLKEIPKESVVDLILSGAVTAEEYENRRRIIEEGLEGFLEGTYQDHALSRLITQDLINKEFPETSFSAGLLSSLMKDPKEAQLAYELLKALKESR